jgi:hypothetical protein
MALLQGGRTVLHCAAGHGNVEVVRLLLEHRSELVHMTDEVDIATQHSSTPLAQTHVQFRGPAPQHAVPAGCVMVRFRVEEHRIAQRSRTALQYAVESNCVEVVRLLLRHRPDVADVRQDEVHEFHVRAAVTHLHAMAGRRAELRYTGQCVMAMRLWRGCCWIIVRSWRT